MGKRQSDTNNRTIATHKRARRDYQIEETYTAGLVLMGSEVKALRSGQLSVGDAYVEEDRGELFLTNLHIGEYKYAHKHNHEPMRRRKLLLSRREIEKLTRKIDEKGFSCVPLRFFLANGWVKVELGVGRGKKFYDRRQDIKERDAKREMDRARRR